MSAATMSRDATLPRPPDGLGLGAILAILVHLLLIAALALGVNWRAHEPDAVVAELWSAVPQTAAPRPTAPPPAPAPPPQPQPEKRPAPVARPAPEPKPQPDAQIAIEKAKQEAARREADEREAARREARREADARDAQRRQQAEREAQVTAQKDKAERDKAQREKARAEEARREQAAREAEERQKKELAEKARKEEAMLAAQREANLKRIQGQAGATGEEGSTGTAARSSGPSASYAGRIRARIKPNIVFTDSVNGNPVAMVQVNCAPDGTIVSRKLVKSSGSASWDESVLRAIDRTEILPRDVDGRVPSVMQIDFRPRD
jgi:colicin import membrane protein